MKKVQILCAMMFLVACGSDPAFNASANASDAANGGDTSIASQDVKSTDAAPTCVPSLEICDGIDNDCDGFTDELFPALGLGCGYGACSDGVVVCAPGHLTTICSSYWHASAEKCDGIDNDCNGFTDETFTDLGEGCGTGACMNGVMMCDPKDSMNTVCSTLRPPYESKEICDGIDNDCNGKTDDSPDCDPIYEPCYKLHGADLGKPCMGKFGVCAIGGVLECGDTNFPELECSVNPGSSNSQSKGMETCGDNLDNNCDGKTDEGCYCPDEKTLDTNGVFAGWCNKCTGECKILPDIQIDDLSFKLVAVMSAPVTEDKVFTINAINPSTMLSYTSINVIAAGKQFGVIDLGFGIGSVGNVWYAICNTQSAGGCEINPVQTSPKVTEFYPPLAEQIFLVKNHEWTDLTAQLQPAMMANTGVHGDDVSIPQ